MEDEDNNNQDINVKMKYNLLGKYFIDKNSYFEGLKEKANLEYLKMLNNFKCKIPYYTQFLNTFKREINNKGMLNKYYLNAEKNIEEPENNTINKLKNGIYFYNFTKKDDNKVQTNAFVYYIKNEDIEDSYISNIENIESMRHSDYEKEEIQRKIEAKAKSDEQEEMITYIGKKKVLSVKGVRNNSISKDSKYNEDKLTGIKNRALTLESLVNFNFKKLNILQLPDLIFNISNPKSRLFLYREFDGAYMNENDENIPSKNLEFILPFNIEKTFEVKEKSTKEVKENDFMILKKSIIFIEVKMHVPKKKEIDEKQNLKNVIKNMFQKVDFFLKVYIDIFGTLKVQNIQLLLLYNQNKIKDYKDYIKTYIQENKSYINDYFKEYNFFFNIMYICPPIGKISLNTLNKRMISIENKQEKMQNELNEISFIIKKNEIEILKLKEESLRAREESSKIKESFEKFKKNSEKEKCGLNDKIKKLVERLDKLEKNNEKIENSNSTNETNKEEEKNKIVAKDSQENNKTNKTGNINNYNNDSRERRGFGSRIPDCQEYKSIYTKLGYIYQYKCKNKKIEYRGLEPLIQDHSEFSNLFHECFENEHLKGEEAKSILLNHYKFKPCNARDCPLRINK